MKSFFAVSVVAVLAAGAAHGQTAVTAGLWEVTDKTTMEGVQPMPSAAKRICIKGGEATIERLLYPTPDDFAKHGCTFEPGPRQAGVFKARTVCPATDTEPGVTADAEINFKADSYEGIGTLLVKDKAGTTLKGTSVLSGKRVGDC